MNTATIQSRKRVSLKERKKESSHLVQSVRIEEEESLPYRDTGATGSIGAVAGGGQRSHRPASTTVENTCFLAVGIGHERKMVEGRHVTRTVQRTICRSVPKIEKIGKARMRKNPNIEVQKCPLRDNFNR